MTKVIISIALMLSMLTAGAQTDTIVKQEQTTTTTSKTNKKHELKGKATYYGDKYKSTRRTANGERFDKDAYTAAHKTLPFGSVVKVTNKTNGKSVTVRITDRGPFGPGRVIDVTPKAARDLDMIRAGVVPCEIEILSIPDIRKNKNKRT